MAEGVSPLTGRVIAITGATGFLGTEFRHRWTDAGATLRPISREAVPGPTQLREALDGATTVLHLGAMVHVMGASGMQRLDEFRRDNVEWTRTLLRSAAAAGVSEFVLLSSVKAVGEKNTSPWDETTEPRPQDAYGRSKLEAEQVVLHEGGVPRTAVLRIPLAYGPGMKANMLQLFRLVERGLPLPLGAIANRRSFIFSGNLVAAVEALLASPGAWGQVLHVSDGLDLSTPELIRTIARGLGRSARLFPVPPVLLRALGKMADGLGRLAPSALSSAAVSRLVDSLTIDITRIQGATGYRPRYSPDQAFGLTAQWYLSRPPR